MAHKPEICAMQILVAAATELEIAPFIKNNPSADILITGVGAPATVYHLAKRLQLIDYDLVIQAGIAGSFNPSTALGTVVVVNADTFADIGIKSISGFTTIFEAGLENPDRLPYTKTWLMNTHPVISQGYPEVKAITVNMITDNRDHIKLMASKFHADIESMEGAALHYVCLCEEVPFLQLRSLSNYIGDRDKSNWDMKLAIGNLNNALQKIYENLLHN